MQIIEIRDLIRQLGEKHTVILSSHILSEVQAICESVLIIAHGRLVAFDTPQNLEKAIAPNRLELCADAQEAELRAILAQVPAVAGVEAQPWQNGCRAVLTLDTAALHEECRNIFFAFARAGKAIVQMTPVKADLENIFIELTESDQPEGQPQASTPGKEEPQDESRVEA